MASNDELPTSLSLEPDYVTVPGQNFALVSFVGPSCRQKNEKFGMKIRGVFATREDAASHVKRIQRSGDNLLDIFLLDMYQWAVIPPDPEGIEDHEFQEKFLQDMMKGYVDSQRAAKEHFEERKRLVMTDGLDNHLLPHERIPEPGKALLEPLGAMPEFTATTDESAPGPSASQVLEDLEKN
jgi:hypothetical protein